MGKKRRKQQWQDGVEVYKNSGTRAGTADKVEEIGRRRLGRVDSRRGSVEYADGNKQILTTSLTHHYAAVMDSEGTLGRGHSNGGRGLRRQRSLEWRERRGYGAGAQSSSDDEDNARHAVGPVSSSSGTRGARSPGQVFASILAQQYGNAGDRSYRTGSDTEGAATTDNPTTPFPTPPPTLTPNHRQASPFPLESTNSRRHHYNGSISSERSRNGNGETVYAASAKKATSGGGTLGRRTRRGHASALSSSSTASDRSETVFPDEHTRIHLTNDTGRDSPPEPAPPEVPPRGPSLHATHTLRTQQNRNGCPPNAASGNFTVPSDQMPNETYSGKWLHSIQPCSNDICSPV
ncbi:hypothetical protein X777_04776 [Ooceraea biroi]|uniref:Uncharacterized protein n=1 Tax=Ooceraea biroi TaxID=2015173 RepID=A0A026WH85_OOCBI|nr:hypothetical protein X777_04776 [Ooceraea biroi]